MFFDTLDNCVQRLFMPKNRSIFKKHYPFERHDQSRVNIPSSIWKRDLRITIQRRKSLKSCLLIRTEKGFTIETLLMQSARSNWRAIRLVIDFTIANCVGMTKVVFKTVGIT